MTTLVFVEDHDNVISKKSLATMSAALKLNPSCHVIVLGRKSGKLIEQLKRFSSVAKIIVCNDKSLDAPLAEVICSAIFTIAKLYNYILFPDSTLGKNIMPRLAALLDVQPLSDVTKIKELDTFERPIYAGNAFATIKMLDKIKIFTIRSTAFPSQLKEGPSQEVPMQVISANANPTFSPSSKLSEYMHLEASLEKHVDLASARIVVSGGRGLKSKENFKLVESLATKLGAAIGASRAAVDAGFVPNDCQVGQTGKIVAPDLYIAIGISGAIQHIAGMKDSKIIVAINKDPDAPIFQIANYGLVGDLFEIVPELEKSL